MRAALATGVLAIVLAAWPATLAGAASAGGPSGGPIGFDEAGPTSTLERPPLARLTATQAQRIGLAQPELARAQRLRPGSVVRVRYFLEPAGWRVAVRARANGRTLAFVDIDDATGRVLVRHALPIGDYPPQLTERDAIDEVVADPAVRDVAREWGGVRELRARGTFDRDHWQVDLFDPDRSDGDPGDPVIRAHVDDASTLVRGPWTGHAIAWPMARGERRAFGGTLNQPLVWYGLFVLFALVVVDWARLRSPANLDALALLALAPSYEAFVRGAIEWSVPLALPPLAWLAGHMAWQFVRGVPPAPAPRPPRHRVTRLALRRVSTTALVVAIFALAGVRIGLVLDGGNVIDVGYAGVAGARLELEGTAPWGNMPDDVDRGDTYGPANYLAYVPAVALLDDHAGSDGDQGTLDAARATAIAADLGCALVLALVGWRWLSRRAGALLALGWLACPWTTLVLASSANDSLVALALVAAFAALPRAWLRGALVAVAALVKVAPAIALTPLLHAGMRRRLRQSLATLAAFFVTLCAGIAWAVWRIEADHDQCIAALGVCGGPWADLALLHERTIAFQAGRESPFSPWGLYDLDVLQQAFRVLVVLVALAFALRPRVRDAWQVAAGIAALLVAVQLSADHWFYLYVPWFVPFVLLVLVARRERPGPPFARD